LRKRTGGGEIFKEDGSLLGFRCKKNRKKKNEQLKIKAKDKSENLGEKERSAEETTIS